MRIKPSENWTWCFDKEQNLLALDFGKGEILNSCYDSKMLLNNISDGTPFSLTDVGYYYQFYECAKQYYLPESYCAKLALNAVVVLGYLKPLMQKSWYFLPSNEMITPQVFDLVTAIKEDNNEKIPLLIVDTDEHVSVCMVVQKQILLAEKPIFFGGTIKLINDRLSVADLSTITGYWR